MNVLVIVPLVIVCWKLILPGLWTLFAYSIGKLLLSKRKQLRSAGEWAIVTGSTDGIGKAYAEELAKDGLNVMLISRNPEKLGTVAAYLESKYKVQTKTVPCNFVKSDVYAILEKEVNSLPSIACLVNNVGISYASPGPFASTEWITMDFIRDMINCNMTSMASLTRLVLPIMLRQNSPGSAIINLSSYSGVVPTPYLSFYGATKAFVKHFTEALSYELEDSNVSVQTVQPLLVATAMTNIKRSSFFIPNAQQFAASALNMLGVESVTMGYFGHALQSLFLSLHPMVMAREMKKRYMKTLNKKSKAT